MNLSRRTLIGRSAIVFLVAALALAPTSGASKPAQAASKPNVVVIISDDQRWDTIGRCVGGFDAYDLSAGADSCMPLVQQDLVAHGVTFMRGQVSQSLCCPARASIFTGQYSRHTGVDGVNGFTLFNDSSTVATWLHDGGYRTGMIGKYLNGYGNSGTPLNYVPPGWDSWHGYYGFNGTTDDPYLNYNWIDWETGGTAVQTRYSTGYGRARIRY